MRPAVAMALSSSHFGPAFGFGVHALACLAPPDTLKGPAFAEATADKGHPTPPSRQNKNRWMAPNSRLTTAALWASLRPWLPLQLAEVIPRSL